VEDGVDLEDVSVTVTGLQTVKKSVGRQVGGMTLGMSSKNCSMERAMISLDSS
jgi:hypothetical protein